MPRPSNAVDRPDLGSLAWEYLMEDKTNVGLGVMPIFGVPENSMQYPVIPLESIVKQPDTLVRDARGHYRRADWEFQLDTFTCIEHGWEELVDDRESNLYQRFFDAEAVSTERAVGILLRGHEKRVQQILSASTNVSDLSDWTAPSTATPKADIKTGAQAMRTTFGVTPNVVVMSATAFENVLVTDELKTYLQFTSPHLVQGIEAQRQTLARYFSVMDVLVGDQQVDNAKRGKAATLTEIWAANEVFLCRVNASQNLRAPSVGRTFLWQTDSPDVMTTETYREEQARSDVVRVRHNTAEKVQYAGAIRKLTPGG